MKFLFCLFIIRWCVIEGRLSGIYYDNGLDQTVIQRLLTKQEKREVEFEILNLLGLPTRPKPAIPVPVHLRSSAPKFLLDIYKNMEDGSNGRTKRSDFRLSGRDQQAIEESDIIMSFPAQNSHAGHLRHDHGRHLWFDVSEVPIQDAIVDAELRLYKQRNISQHKSDESYTVTVYQVITDKNGQRELEYIDTVNTTSDFEDWLIFNMTGPLSSWVAIPETNQGLYVSLTAHSGHEVKPEDAGIITMKGEEEHQPFMVGFFKASTGSSKVRQTRETRKRKKKSDPGDYSRNPFFPNPQHWSSRSCQMQNLYVSFKDLEWQDWIIAPEGYQAFYCSGECNFPLNAHMNATNHAIVQTLVHLMNPTHVPKPCCAPTKLSAISVLYFLEDSNVILKKYKNMVVKSCGCH